MDLSWCLLPDEILDLFLQRLSLPDCLTFSEVCTSWRRVFLDRRRLTRPPPFMVRPDNSGRLCSLYGGQLLKLHSAKLNMPQHGRILGSSMGWLVIPGNGCEFYLLNPISKEHIVLPIFDNRDLRWAFLDFYHVVLSTTPLSGDCIIVLRGCIDDCIPNLAWCRLRDRKWNLSGFKLNLGTKYDGADMMFYNGELYLGDKEDFHIFDIFTFCPQMKFIGSVSFTSISASRHWSDRKLVQSGTELLLVGVRYHKKFSEEFNSRYRDYTFDIFKLAEEPNKWVRVQSLGKRALLVGYNCGTTIQSFCIEDLMGSGFEANCIYFWRKFRRTVELVKFSLADGSTQRIPVTLSGNYASSEVYWIVPQTWST